MKVFVSATSDGLKKYREAAARQISRLNARPVEQAAFGGDFQTVVNMLRGRLQECDAMVCLVGPCYGSGPSAQSVDPPRSYTQIEFDLAQKLGLPTCVFFPSARCKLDGSCNDSPQQAQWQQQYCQELRQRDELWYEFDNEHDLGLRIAEAFEKIRPLAAQPALERTIRDHFPTPLARLFCDLYKSERLAELRTLAAECIRFVSLLALHDSLVAGLFGRDSVDANASLQMLSDEMAPRGWRRLLQPATPEGEGAADRFIPRFSAWEAQHSRPLAKLVEAEERSGERLRRKAIEEVSRDIRENLAEVLGGLEFLKRYVLGALLPREDDASEKVALRILRGESPKSLQVRLAVADAEPPRGVYLFDIDRRQALHMEPAFFYRPDITADDVWGLLQVDSTDAGAQLVSLPFVEADDEQEYSLPAFADLAPAQQQAAGAKRPAPVNRLAAWLDEDAARKLFDGEPAPATLRDSANPGFVSKLIDDASWESLQSSVLPTEDADSIYCGLRLAGSPLHSGLLANLFLGIPEDHAHDESSTEHEPQQPSVVHVLRAEEENSAGVQDWFARRCRNWGRIEHEWVLKLDERRMKQAEDGRPALVAEYVAKCRSLERIVASGERLSDATILQLVRGAAELSRAAHRRDLRLLAFPLRHFLKNEDGDWRITGFESCVHADGDFAAGLSRKKYFQKFSRDWEHFAPEVMGGHRRIEPTADVFAIGMLLASLKRWSVEPFAEVPDKAWSDPLWSLLFHCCCKDPNLRVQSAANVLQSLDAWVGGADEPPSLARVEIGDNGGAVQALGIAKHPVTNAQYRHFCDDSRYPPPRHLRLMGEEHEQIRLCLCGPWCPVVEVNLDDAAAYCAWLSRKTGKRWRLPTEHEWINAAGGSQARQYPWGDAAPDFLRANHEGRFRGPTVVGAFDRGQSATGCFDMGGNVWEWCTDVVRDGIPRRVLKGGAYDYPAAAMKLTSKTSVIVAHRSPHVGFRVVCEEPP